MNILMLLAALALSAIAAYYSIAGLAAIFAAAVIPIVVMGSVLEVSKLVVASWLYRNWKELPKLLKSYFLVAVIILMLLTSMGIFGYLSKAHLDQAVPTGEVQASVTLIDEEINIEKESINENRNILAQLDKQVNEAINRTTADTSTKGIDRSVTIRKQQSKERAAIREAISASQTKIAKLQQEKAPLASQIRQIEAEVGPIKYIAALIYGDNPDQNVLEKAVRWVIIMIVSVFDPLAVLMLVGYNWTLNRKEEPIEDEKPVKDWHKEWVPDSEAWPPWDPEFNDVEQPIKPTKEWHESFYKEPEPNFDFLKGDDVIKTPPPPAPEPSIGIKTIEQEVEELQPVKGVDYDSAGRRITP